MTAKSVLKSFITLAGSLAICLLAGYLWWYPALPGMPAWYDSLAKPALSPPPEIFPPAWMFSFLLMGFTLFFILQSSASQREGNFGMILFVSQLLLTLIWGYAFFAAHAIFPAFLCIIAVFATLLSAVIQVFRFSVYGGMLLSVYFFWVCFLTYVSYGIMVLNNAVYQI
jgi:tryptophan-rich sensory protein